MDEDSRPLNIPTEIVDIDEARRRMPQVKLHLETIMQLTPKIQELHGKIDSETESRDDHQHLIDDAETEWKAALRAMNDLGAYLKDPEIGLIDFYAWRGEDLVFLCWKAGEPDINFWHGLHDGLTGRRPLEEF